jgi:hypothetical protein
MVAINDIRFDRLKASGFKGIILDKDNTITTPYARSIPRNLQVITRLLIFPFDLFLPRILLYKRKTPLETV